MNNKNLKIYTLENDKLKVTIANIGASIINVYVKREKEEPVDVALGHNKLEDYLINNGNLGCVVGRNANRIEKAQFKLNDKVYILEKNDGENNLHTGKNAVQHQIFEVIEHSKNHIKLNTKIVHLSDDFPGDLNLDVTYELDNDYLIVNYEAISNQDTIVNVTNHSYFNLNGQDNSNIYNHKLFINSNYYMPNNSESLPTKEILKVDNSAYDFREEKLLKDALISDHPQIKLLNGFDNNFLLNCCDDDLAASLYSDTTKIRLNVYSDLCAMHVYTANHFPDETTRNKNNGIYPLHGGIAFETQFSPNTPNTPWLRSSVLEANKTFKSTTKYQFITY